MENLGYYFSIFKRRLPYFLIIATVISAISVTVAYTLPPAYESKMVLLVESPQIPQELAASTVQAPAYEQLQILQQRLLTRSNLLDIARKLDVLPNLDKMNPDEIVDAMRARTKISSTGSRRMEAPLMILTFEAPRPRTTSQVLNEYLILIQRQDNEFRKGRSGETLEFFTQEVKRLNQEMQLQSDRILEFKKENTKTLPDSLKFRLDQQANFQQRQLGIDRDISDLRNQRNHLLKLYELTGNSAGKGELSPNQKKLEGLKKQHEEALTVYSPENPRVKMLEARISQLEETIAAEAAAKPEPKPTNAGAGDSEANLPPVMIIQLSEIDNRIASLEDERASIQKRLDGLNETIEKTPEISVELEELTRRYATLQAQYQFAEERLSLAQTGDRIETRSRGQRIAVIEQPAVPSEPTKPNRIMIAGGGTAFGIFAGLALIVLLELLNTTARRPEDIVSKLGITPLTTIPYIQTKQQRFRNRGMKLLLILVILIGVPLAVFAVHTYYLPLDLLAERVMNKLGVRW